MSENKIINFNFDYTVENHPNIKGLQIVDGKNNFPVSWLNQQGYCEYSLYLEHFEGVTISPTVHMVKGDIEHKKLED
ncbi:MAG: CRISPR-associated protein Cas4, partial [Methanobrevibacter sp.]|nr:CRISPR-associated protein Cas4 [Methanobrevibacter sp.]